MAEVTSLPRDSTQGSGRMQQHVSHSPKTALGGATTRFRSGRLSSPLPTRPMHAEGDANTPIQESRRVRPIDADRRREQARRAPRLRTRLRVGIPEVEGDPGLENCLLSLSGMLLHTNRKAGEPGAVRMLRLVNAGSDVAIEIMARIVRVVTHDAATAAGQGIEAISFEFLPAGEEQLRELTQFLRRVAEAETTSKAQEAADVRAPTEVSDPAGDALEVLGLVIETSQPMAPGARFRGEIEIPASGRCIRLSGKTVGAESIGEGEAEKLYRVQVAIDPVEATGADSRGQGPEEASAEDVVHALLDEASPRERPAHQREGVHLSGSLAEVGLPSLLGFVELERASGVLRLTRDAHEAAVFVSKGRIVDVESAIPGSPMDVLGVLLGWSEGEFEFAFQAVERDDVIGKTTTALLLDLARESDEAARG